MTREDTLAAYEVDSIGLIESPGKFESEMLYAPHFWEASLDGSAEALDWGEDSTTYLVTVDDSDRAEFPEIGNDIVAMHVAESDTGFVSVEGLTQAELDTLYAENEGTELAEADEDEESAD